MQKPMGNVLSVIDGYKTYILLGAAIAVVGIEAFIGDIPGVAVPQAAVDNPIGTIWALLMGGAGRSALAKFQ